MPNHVIAVVIPAFRVKSHVLKVVARIGPEVSHIYVVDDFCPEETGRFVENNCTDPRIRVLYNANNRGVGGATLVGMNQAYHDGADVIVKVDGDGQMDPAMIPIFANVILSGEADYAKGNRFFDAETISSMPLMRKLGNAGLSFFAKMSTGYWHTFDPTNGYVAIHGSLIELLPIEKIASRFFFESDMLFRLNILSAKVVDIPMHSHYGDEQSNLNPLREVPRFASAHLRNLGKRVLYNYFLRNFSIASVELVLGLFLLLLGGSVGISSWGTVAPATAGTVMLAALPVIVGSQLLLAFLNFDVQSVPRSALHVRLRSSAQQMKPVKQWDQ